MAYIFSYFCCFKQEHHSTMHSTTKTNAPAHQRNNIPPATLKIASTFAQMSQYGVYLLNIISKEVVYISDHPMLRGIPPSPDFFHLSDLALPEENQQIRNVERACSTAFLQVPPADRHRLIFSFNTHVMVHGHQVMVLHKVALTESNANEQPQIALGLFSPAVSDVLGEITIRIAKTQIAYRYDVQQNTWTKLPPIQLSNEERTMLYLNIQGHNIQSIANIMCKSVDTIKFYRRQVFQKLNKHNITEAIAHAVHYGLI
ncbi:MAG: helix-turn-helix transcriptional regulator [Bacteroidales bacterium]|nr:helix-turn-helix transcriptional regulator [Bacteroidales bacterium]